MARVENKLRTSISRSVVSDIHPQESKQVSRVAAEAVLTDKASAVSEKQVMYKKLMKRNSWFASFHVNAFAIFVKSAM